jgi:transcriptional regulator with XRE-family HTH domain
MNITARIIELCNQKDISINKLADLSDITQSTLNSIMNSQDPNPQFKTIEKICKGLGITLAEFFLVNPTANVGLDLVPDILAIINRPGHPNEYMQAIGRINRMSHEEIRNRLLPFIAAATVIEDGVKYRFVNTEELLSTLNKFKSLPEETRKAITLIIDSLVTSRQ